jgi:PAS domain S-box-containing protein
MHSAASEQETSSWLVSDVLKELELLLRAVISHQSEAVVVVDQDRVCVDASCGACKLFGLPSGSLIGRQIDDLLNPGKLQSASNSEVLPGRIVLAINDGSEKNASAASQDYALFSLDAAARVVDWHSGAERIYGYKREEIAGEDVSRLYPDADGLRATLLEELGKAAIEGHLGSEGWHKRKDGARFWANSLTTVLRDEDLQVQGFARVVRDFSARHRMNEAPLNSRSTLRQRPAEPAVAGIVSGEFDRIIDANDAFLNMVGYSRDALIAGELQWADIAAPEYLPLQEHAHEESLLHGSCTPFEMEYIRKDETRMRVLVACAVLPPSAFRPSPFRWMAFVQDLTARERTEKIADEPGASHEFEEIVGTSAALKRVMGQVEIVAPTDATVLVLGETGTGNERPPKSPFYHPELRRDPDRAVGKRTVRL